MIKKVKQRDVSDCGAACLVSVASHYGLTPSVAAVRQRAGTRADGTSVAGLIAAADHYGLTAKGVKATGAALSLVPRPAVAHVLREDGQHHFVVLVRVGKGKITVMDPGTGRVVAMPRARFAAVWTGVLVLFAPAGGMTPGGRAGQGKWDRLAGLLRPHRTVVAQGILGAALSTLLGLGFAVYVQKIVDYVVVDSNRPLLNLLGLAMGVVVAGRGALTVGQAWLSLRAGRAIELAIVAAYYRHVFTLPQSFYDTVRIGEIISRTQDGVKVRAFLNDAAQTVIVNGLMMIFAVVAMFLVDSRLASLSLGCVVVYAGCFQFARRTMRRYQRRAMEQAAELQAEVVETLGANGTFRRFGARWLALLRIESAFVRALRTAYEFSVRQLVTNNTVMFLFEGYVVLLLWLGAGLVIDGRLSAGQLMSCFALTGHLTHSAQGLLQMTFSAQDAMIAADRLFEFMDLDAEGSQGTVELTADDEKTIRFENVAFGYPGRARVLEAVDAVFPAGTVTLVSGESGHGKSTVLALIQGLYEPAAGRVYVGGYDVRYLSRASLRRSLGCVTQQVEILRGTVSDNIALGDPSPDLRRMIRIAGELGLLTFIESLPKGFDTLVEAGGSNLSGGQRQRLSIARALYRDAPIILLDEPTSSLDAVAEGYVLSTLRRLRDDGKTVVVCGHGSKLPEIADQHLVVHGGSVRPAAPGSTRPETVLQLCS